MDTFIPHLNNIFKDPPKSARSRPNSARPSSASSCPSARLHHEKKEKVAGNASKHKEKEEKERKEDDTEEAETDDEDDWAMEVDKAHSVKDAMRRLWLADSELFYLKGDIIQKMVRYRIEHGWTVESDSESEDEDEKHSA